jgi:AcrR family transcriptional regulator
MNQMPDRAKITAPAAYFHRVPSPRQKPGFSAARTRQADLIAAATSLFAARGFRGTTTKEIAKAAGVSEALLFKYFPTKRALYAAILAEKANLSALVEAIDDVARKRDDKRLFTLIAGYRIRPGADPTMLRLLLFSGLEGHELADMFFSKQHRVINDYVAGYIETRIKEGAFRPTDPLLAARAFIGMVVHHRLLHEIYRIPMHRSHDDTVAAYVELFLNGLAKPRRRNPGEHGPCH